MSANQVYIPDQRRPASIISFTELENDLRDLQELLKDDEYDDPMFLDVPVHLPSFTGVTMPNSTFTSQMTGSTTRLESVKEMVVLETGDKKGPNHEKENNQGLSTANQKLPSTYNLRYSKSATSLLNMSDEDVMDMLSEFQESFAHPRRAPTPPSPASRSSYSQGVSLGSISPNSSFPSATGSIGSQSSSVGSSGSEDRYGNIKGSGNYRIQFNNHLSPQQEIVRNRSLGPEGVLESLSHNKNPTGTIVRNQSFHHDLQRPSWHQHQHTSSRPTSPTNTNRGGFPRISDFSSQISEINETARYQKWHNVVQSRTPPRKLTKSVSLTQLSSLAPESTESDQRGWKLRSQSHVQHGVASTTRRSAVAATSIPSSARATRNVGSTYLAENDDPGEIPRFHGRESDIPLHSNGLSADRMSSNHYRQHIHNNQRSNPSSLDPHWQLSEYSFRKQSDYLTQSGSYLSLSIAEEPEDTTCNARSNSSVSPHTLSGVDISEVNDTADSSIVPHIDLNAIKSGLSSFRVEENQDRYAEIEQDQQHLSKGMNKRLKFKTSFVKLNSQTDSLDTNNTHLVADLRGADSENVQVNANLPVKIDDTESMAPGIMVTTSIAPTSSTVSQETIKKNSKGSKGGRAVRSVRSVFSSNSSRRSARSAPSIASVPSVMSSSSTDTAASNGTSSSKSSVKSNNSGKNGKSVRGGGVPDGTTFNEKGELVFQIIQTQEGPITVQSGKKVKSSGASSSSGSSKSSTRVSSRGGGGAVKRSARGGGEAIRSVPALKLNVPSGFQVPAGSVKYTIVARSMVSNSGKAVGSVRGGGGRSHSSTAFSLGKSTSSS